MKIEFSIEIDSIYRKYTFQDSINFLIQHARFVDYLFM